MRDESRPISCELAIATLGERVADLVVSRRSGPPTSPLAVHAGRRILTAVAALPASQRDHVVALAFAALTGKQLEA